MPLTGGCGCGAVRFEITAPLVSAVYCHCTRCQRRTGTAASASGRVQAGLDFTSWPARIGCEPGGPDGGAEKWFCGDCGSAMFSRAPDDDTRIGVRLGAFDSDPGIRPTAHQYVAYAAAWEPIPDDGLPQFPEARVADCKATASGSGLARLQRATGAER